MSSIKVVQADLSDDIHINAVVSLCDEYARDPMGMDEELDERVKATLAEDLRNFPTTICFLAFIGQDPVGLVNGFYGYSTFKGKKLINVHDLAVLPGQRGQGVGEALLIAVEEKARQTGCCKVTLEVREDNRARALYERFGFTYGDPMMFFMTKELLEL